MSNGRSRLYVSVLSLTLLAAAVCAAQQPQPPKPQMTNIVHMPTAAGGERARGDGEKFLPVQLEFNSESDQKRFSMPTVPIINRAGRWADVLLPLQNEQQAQAVLEELWNACVAPDDAHGLVWMENAPAVSIPPPPARGIERMRGPGKEPIARGGLDGLTGKGVIIVIVDTGIDFRHPDFIADAGGTPASRLMYLWDTTEAPSDKPTATPSPASYPGGRPLGRLYSREELNAALAAGGAGQVLSKDINGHGTSCAGIAAGSGTLSKGEYIGVAPGAELIGVRVATDGPFTNGYLLGAICTWVEKVAAGRPYVISCSFGSNVGSHDGMRLDERQLEAHFPESAVGRAICIAAGNEGAFPTHAGFKLAAGESKTLSWDGGKSAGFLQLFMATADNDAFQVEFGPGVEPVARFRHVFTNQMIATYGIAAEAGKITIRNASSGSLTGDAYVAFLEEPMRGFNRDVANAMHMIGSPAAAVAAITVGSYDWNGDQAVDGSALVVGSLSSYSCPGPLRFGDVNKPDIVAPGQWFEATCSHDVEHEYRGGYWWFNGTSAATPYVSGVIALMLERNPKLTVGEIRALLHKHATSDKFTGSVPNPQWGYGKLDLEAIKRMLAAIK